MTKANMNRALLLTAVCITLLSACGGSSSNSSSASTDAQTPAGGGQIQGVATPSSVSVVTATNAQ